MPLSCFVPSGKVILYPIGVQHSPQKSLYIEVRHLHRVSVLLQLIDLFLKHHLCRLGKIEVPVQSLEEHLKR